MTQYYSEEPVYLSKKKRKEKAHLLVVTVGVLAPGINWKKVEIILWWKKAILKGNFYKSSKWGGGGSFSIVKIILHFLGVFLAFFGVFLKYYMFCFSDIDWLNGALLSDLQPQLPPEGVGIAGKGPFTAHLSLQPFIPHLFIRRFLHHLSPIPPTTTPWCSETKYIKNLP